MLWRALRLRLLLPAWSPLAVWLGRLSLLRGSRVLGVNCFSAGIAEVRASVHGFSKQRR